MIKVDWNSAPEWAKYIAYDVDGRGFWYETKPELCSTKEYWFPFEDTRCSPVRIPDCSDQLVERPEIIDEKQPPIQTMVETWKFFVNLPMNWHSLESERGREIDTIIRSISDEDCINIQLKE